MVVTFKMLDVSVFRYAVARQHAWVSLYPQYTISLAEEYGFLLQHVASEFWWMLILFV
jgi:hypothetical protein